MRPWMGAGAGGHGPAGLGFNGATALRPWMVDQFGGDNDRSELQWGHGLAAVDGYATDSVHDGAALLQWGHGLAAVDGCQTPHS